MTNQDMFEKLNFKSDLHFRWALFFDLIEWEWEYLPTVEQEWKPDFIVSFPCGHSECPPNHVLWVQVQPLDSVENLPIRYPFGRDYDTDSKIGADASAIFGNSPHSTYWEMAHGAGGGSESVPNWTSYDVDSAWKEALLRLMMLGVQMDSFAAKMRALDQMAASHRDDKSVIGFAVVGYADTYEFQWNSEGRSPQRWRSGEWFLRSGTEFKVLRRSMKREPIVKVYRDEGPGGNGAFAISTSAANPDEFLRECAIEMESVIEDRIGDIEFAFDHLLPQICELWAKLKGYKTEGVYERRLLVIGEPLPESHMRCINQSKSEQSTEASVK